MWLPCAIKLGGTHARFLLAMRQGFVDLGHLLKRQDLVLRFKSRKKTNDRIAGRRPMKIRSNLFSETYYVSLVISIERLSTGSSESRRCASGPSFERNREGSLISKSKHEGNSCDSFARTKHTF